MPPDATSPLFFFPSRNQFFQTLPRILSGEHNVATSIIVHAAAPTAVARSLHAVRRVPYKHRG